MREGAPAGSAQAGAAAGSGAQPGAQAGGQTGSPPAGALPAGAPSAAPRAGATPPAAPPVLSIRELDPKTRTLTPLVRAVAGAGEADLAWTPDGLLLMAHNGALYGWRRGEAAWTRGADLDALGLKGVTRMAISPKGDRIAFVAEPC